jgi:hypothetical protein
LHFKNVAKTKSKCSLNFSMAATAECFVLFLLLLHFRMENL